MAAFSRAGVMVFTIRNPDLRQWELTHSLQRSTEHMFVTAPWNSLNLAALLLARVDY